MTRILTDIPDDDVKELDALARRQGKSRAAVLREAISNYLVVREKEGFEKYFGLWERHGSTIDGLEYEQHFRGEWPDIAELEPPNKKRSAT